MKKIKCKYYKQNVNNVLYQLRIIGIYNFKVLHKMK